MRRPMLAALVAALALVSVPTLLSQGTGDPPHGDLPLDCAECHNPERWVPVDKTPTFRHQKTGFVLESAHAQVSCRGCHRSLVFNRVGAACADCHQDAHRGELGFECESCHTPTTWTNQREMFRVHDRTRFPLFASHSRLDCTACHRSQSPYQFKNTPAECGNCHLSTYLGTANPSHVQAGFSRRCEDCHLATSPSWHSAAFSHPASFPLQGGHAALACARCHGGGTYTGLSPACVSCHQKDYAASTNPNHAAGRFPTTCDNCHTIVSWRPAKFDHDATRFPLTGAHGRVDCSRCHSSGQYAGTPTSCAACHQPDYDRTTNPNHKASAFPLQCQSCHNTGAWRPANFDHNATRFPLTGAHTRTDCAKCHVGGRYTGTPTDCYSCHQANYAATTNPNHQASQIPKTCQACHSTSAWRPATVDHSATRFPLTGAHTRVDCARCHVGGRYTGTPTDCYACHQPDYAGTTNPNHPAANFPTQCLSCHTTAAWKPATFDHDGQYFPIYSGTHRGRWTSCSECHVSSGNYKVFECILCHQHSNRTEVDSKHRGVTGYSYTSTACYRCHRNGRAGDAGGFGRLQ